MRARAAAALALAAAAALAVGAGCTRGDIRGVENYRRDLPDDLVQSMRARAHQHLFAAPAYAIPNFYFKHEEIYQERDDGAPLGYHAEARSIYFNGIAAQRAHDANWDSDGTLVSYRLTDHVLFGALWRADEVWWREPSGRERYYYDGGILFGAFGVSEANGQRDVLLMWFPIPLP